MMELTAAEALSWERAAPSVGLNPIARRLPRTTEM